jgi:protein-disulfide isomerase
MSDGERSLELQRLLGIAAAAQAPVKDVDVTIGVGERPALGATDAAVVLVEFHDFQCGFCRRHAAQTMPLLMSDYVDARRLRILFFDNPVASAHPFAAQAAEAARCAADQGRYLALRRRFYDHAKALHPQFLPDHAEAAGLDVAAFQACLDSDRHAAAVAADQALAVTLGVRGTPTFFLGVPNHDGSAVQARKRIDGAQPMAVFRDVIDRLEAEASLESGASLFEAQERAP